MVYPFRKRNKRWEGLTWEREKGMKKKKIPACTEPATYPENNNLPEERDHAEPQWDSSNVAHDTRAEDSL